MAIKVFEAFGSLFLDKGKVVSDIKDVEKRAVTAAQNIEKNFGEGFKRGFGQAGDAMEEFGVKAGKIVGLISNPFALAAAAVGGFSLAMASATKAALAFDAEFQKSAVFLSGTPAQIAAIEKSLHALDARLGSTAELLPTFRKALLDSADPRVALEMTKLAASFAKVTGSTPTEAVGLLSDLVDSFGIKAEKASRITDVLFFTMKQGGGDVAELAANFPRLADAAADSGIQVEELGAALATLGEVAGASPQKNIQALILLLQQLTLNISKFRERGVDVAALVAQFGPLIGRLRAIRQFATDAETGVLSKERLAELGISARNYIATLKLISDEGLAGLAAKTAQFNREAPGATEAAFKKMSATIGEEWKRLGVEIEKLKETMGAPVLILVKFSVESAADVVKAVRQLYETAEAERVRASATREARGGLSSLTPSIRRNEPVPPGLVPRPFRREKPEAELTDFAKRMLASDPGLANRALDRSVAAAQSRSLAEMGLGGSDAEVAGAQSGAKRREEVGQLEKDAARDLQSARARRRAEFNAAAAEDIGRAATRDGQLRQLQTAGAQAAIQIEREVEIELAKQQGREIRGTEDYFNRRVALRREAAATEKQILADETTATTAATRERLKGIDEDIASKRKKIATPGEVGSGGVAKLKLETDIQGLLQQRDAAARQITEASAKSADDRRSIEQRAATDIQAIEKDRPKAILDGIKLVQEQEAKRFETEVALGRRSVTEAIARNKQIAADTTRSFDERKAAMVDAFNLEKRLAEDAATLAAAIRARELDARIGGFEAAGREAEQRRQIDLGAIDADRTGADISRQQEEERARRIGRGIVGTDAHFSRQAELRKRAADVERRAIDEGTKADTAASRVRIQNIDVEIAAKTKLFELSGQGEGQGARAAEIEGLNKERAAGVRQIVDAEQQAATARKLINQGLSTELLSIEAARPRAILDGLALVQEQEAKRFQAAAAMGQRSVAEAIARNRAIADDTVRTFDERMDAMVEAFNLERKLADDTLDFRKALNLASIKDEVQAWAERGRAAEAGSQVQIDALKRVAELTRQQRDEARSAASAALGIAQQRRQERENPPSDVRFTSTAQIEREARRQREEDQRTLNTARSGGRVREDKLSGALSRQGTFEQIKQAGGVMGSFAKALGELPALFLKNMGEATAVTETELEKIVGLFRGAFKQIEAAGSGGGKTTGQRALAAAQSEGLGIGPSPAELAARDAIQLRASKLNSNLPPDQQQDAINASRELVEWEAKQRDRQIGAAGLSTSPLAGGFPAGFDRGMTAPLTDLQHRALAMGDVGMALDFAKQDTAAATRKRELVDQLIGGGSGAAGRRIGPEDMQPMPPSEPPSYLPEGVEQGRPPGPGMSSLGFDPAQISAAVEAVRKGMKQIEDIVTSGKSRVARGIADQVSDFIADDLETVHG